MGSISEIRESKYNRTKAHVKMADKKLIGVITPSRKDLGIWKRETGNAKYKGQKVEFVRITEKNHVQGCVFDEVEEGRNNHLVSSLVRYEAYARVRREYK